VSYFNVMASEAGGWKLAVERALRLVVGSWWLVRGDLTLVCLGGTTRKWLNNLSLALGGRTFNTKYFAPDGVGTKLECTRTLS